MSDLDILIQEYALWKHILNKRVELAIMEGDIKGIIRVVGALQCLIEFMEGKDKHN